MTKNRKSIIAGLVAVLLIAGAAVWWFVLRDTTYDAKTTSKSITAQEGYTGGTSRGNGSASGNAQGGATDTRGNDVPENPGTTGTSSADGVVTVYSPAKDATLVNGDIITGAAKDLTKVQYRLVDNDTGVVAQGVLDVVDGKFSGVLNFAASSTTGSLEVFSFDSTGKEINSVEVKVKFKG
jgi:hypothetical protein